MAWRRRRVHVFALCFESVCRLLGRTIRLECVSGITDHALQQEMMLRSQTESHGVMRIQSRGTERQRVHAGRDRPHVVSNLVGGRVVNSDEVFISFSPRMDVGCGMRDASGGMHLRTKQLQILYSTMQRRSTNMKSMQPSQVPRYFVPAQNTLQHLETEGALIPPYYGSSRPHDLEHAGIHNTQRRNSSPSP